MLSPLRHIKKLQHLIQWTFDDFRWLGTAYRQIKKDSLAAMTWEEALKDTTQSIALRSYLYGEVGSIWMNFKRFDRAAEFFQKRVQLDTTAVGALINFAQLFDAIRRI